MENNNINLKKNFFEENKDFIYNNTDLISLYFFLNLNDKIFDKYGILQLDNLLDFFASIKDIDDFENIYNFIKENYYEDENKIKDFCLFFFPEKTIEIYETNFSLFFSSIEAIITYIKKKRYTDFILEKNSIKEKIKKIAELFEDDINLDENDKNKILDLKNNLDNLDEFKVENKKNKKNI